MMQIRYVVDSARAKAAMQKAPDLVDMRLEDALARGAMEIARLGRGKAPKAFSTLANSINASRVGRLFYRVAPGVNYARPVEEGRHAGVQPGTSNGLMEWVRQKTGLTGPDLERKTFVIARAIGRRGIAPQPYMAPAADEGRSIVSRLADEAVARACAECGA